MAYIMPGTFKNLALFNPHNNSASMEYHPHVVRRTVAFKDITSLSLDPMNVTLVGKWVFAHVSKVRILRWEGYPGLPEWTHKCVYKWKQGSI